MMSKYNVCIFFCAEVSLHSVTRSTNAEIKEKTVAMELQSFLSSNPFTPVAVEASSWDGFLNFKYVYTKFSKAMIVLVRSKEGIYCMHSTEPFYRTGLSNVSCFQEFKEPFSPLRTKN